MTLRFGAAFLLLAAGLLLSGAPVASADNGSCTGSVAANGILTCNLEFAQPATKVTVLSEQVCSGAGTMGVQLYPQYAVGVNQTREQFLAAELTQNLPCNGTATIAQRRWVAGGLKRFKLTIQNADATNVRTIQSEWFSENSPVVPPTEVAITGSVVVKGDSTVGAERVHVECGDCNLPPGEVGSVTLSGPVTLDTATQDRLDLSWWGIWLIPGLGLGVWLGSGAVRQYKRWTDV